LQCVESAIINKQLKTTDFLFSWLSLHGQWCYTNTQFLQPKKSLNKAMWDQEPN